MQSVTGRDSGSNLFSADFQLTRWLPRFSLLAMLSKDEFTDLARLARLDPADPDLQGIRGDFNKILDYVNQINAVDTAKVDASYSREETRNNMRADEAGDVLGPAAIGEIAPRWEAGHFVVPGAIESE